MQPAEHEALDRPWPLWASVIISGVLAFSVVFGFIVLPIVQATAPASIRGRVPWSECKKAPAHPQSTDKPRPHLSTEN
jgi:hypothetical protein